MINKAPAAGELAREDICSRSGVPPRTTQFSLEPTHVAPHAALQRFRSFARGREVRGLGPKPAIDLPTQLRPQCLESGRCGDRQVGSPADRPEASPTRSLITLPWFTAWIARVAVAPRAGSWYADTQVEVREISQPRYHLSGASTAQIYLLTDHLSQQALESLCYSSRTAPGS